MSVDVDEADVAVLNQNLIKSKELFDNISKSLNKIDNKSSIAASKIKPILRDVNKLKKDRQEIDRGLEKLKEVSEYAAMATTYEDVLSNPIEIIGLKKYVDSLNRAKLLLREMKTKIRKFYGVLINFESAIDKAELNLVQHFRKSLINEKTNDIVTIMKYFDNKNIQIDLIVTETRSHKLLDRMKVVENASTFKPKTYANVKQAPPYEKGTNGINAYCHELVGALREEEETLTQLGSDGLMSNIIGKQMDKLGELLDANYVSFFTESNIINHDILMFEIIENLDMLNKEVRKATAMPVEQHARYYKSYTRLIQRFSVIFKELFRFNENKIHTLTNVSELSVTDAVIELVTKMRKISEYPQGLLQIVSTMQLGEWLNIKPPLKFISVYTSVINNSGNSEDAAFLLSSLFSDLIDSIVINVEVTLKGESLNFKKSTQGYFLIKIIILIENIINRSKNLFDILGTTGIERLGKLKNRFLKLFLDDWNYASYIIIRDMTQLTTMNAQQSGSNSGSTELSSKEKEQVKELFKNFNESFEEALKNYEKFNISDPNLKVYLINEIKKLILNAYFKLYDKYGNSNFTKNRSKYVKYDKHQFENILSQRLG